MSLARFASIHLARFQTTRLPGKVIGPLPEGVLFCEVATDVRASGLEREGFVHLMMGLHEDEGSAEKTLEERERIAPWMDEASEVYGAVLEPYRHKGEVNHLNREEPGLVFSNLGRAAKADEPFVVITSVGWKLGEGFDIERAKAFGEGVTAVRISMTGMEGLHSQQTFSFPGRVVIDPVTVTFWRNDEAVRQFAYGPAVHKMQMDQYRLQETADRTSFTRFRVKQHTGTWYGRNPLVWG